MQAQRYWRLSSYKDANPELRTLRTGWFSAICETSSIGCRTESPSQASVGPHPHAVGASSLRTTTISAFYPAANFQSCPYANLPRRQVRKVPNRIHVGNRAVLVLANSQLSAATRERLIDGAKTILEIAKESADFCPPLKSCLGGISALIKLCEVGSHRVAPRSR